MSEFVALSWGVELWIFIFIFNTNNTDRFRGLVGIDWERVEYQKFCILYFGKEVWDTSCWKKFLLSNDLEGIGLYVRMNTCSFKPYFPLSVSLLEFKNLIFVSPSQRELYWYSHHIFILEIWICVCRVSYGESQGIVCIMWNLVNWET